MQAATRQQPNPTSTAAHSAAGPTPPTRYLWADGDQAPGWTPLPVDLTHIKGSLVAIWPRRTAADELRGAAIYSACKAAGARPMMVDPTVADPGESLADLMADPVRRAHAIRALDAVTSPPPARASSAEPEIDLSVLARIAAEAAPATPLDLAPAWSAWVEATGKDVAAAPDHVLLALLSAAAGLTAGAIAVQPWAGWTEPTVAKFGLVGESGAGKTQALGAVVGPVKDIEQQARQAHQAALATWQIEAAVAKLRKDPPPPKPVSPLHVLGDATPEALAHRLAQRNGLGLWQVTPEGASAVHQLTRYSGGGVQVTGALGFELESFDAQWTSVARRNLGDEPLHLRLAVANLSGLQPDVAGMLLDLDRKLAVGLTARWAFVLPDPILVPPPRPQDIDAPAVHGRQAQWAQAARRLIALGEAAASDVAGGRRWLINLSPEAAQRFDDWRIAWREFTLRESAGTPSGWDAKAAGWVLRLAGIGAQLQWAASDAPVGSPMLIDLPLIEAAIRARVHWLRAHRRRVEAECETPGPERLACTLGRWIVATGSQAVDVVALRRRVRLPGLRSEAAILVALTELQAAGFVAPGQWLPRDLRTDALPRIVTMNPRAIAIARNQIGPAWASAGAVLRPDKHLAITRAPSGAFFVAADRLQGCT